MVMLRDKAKKGVAVLEACTVDLKCMEQDYNFLLQDQSAQGQSCGYPFAHQQAQRHLEALFGWQGWRERLQVLDRFDDRCRLLREAFPRVHEGREARLRQV